MTCIDRDLVAYYTDKLNRNQDRRDLLAYAIRDARAFLGSVLSGAFGTNRAPLNRAACDFATRSLRYSTHHIYPRSVDALRQWAAACNDHANGPIPWHLPCGADDAYHEGQINSASKAHAVWTLYGRPLPG